MKPQPIRSAFTLLETLIALALVTTLMALAWSLFSTFSRLETRARKQVRGLEITRTLARQLRNDLDQLVRVSSENESPKNRLETVVPDSGSLIEAAIAELPNEISSGLSLESEFGNVALDSSGDFEFDSPFFEGDSNSISFLIPPAQSDANGPSGWQVVSYEWSPNNDQSDSGREESVEGSELMDDSQPRIENLNQSSSVFTRRVSSCQQFRQRRELKPDSMVNDLLEGIETIEIGRVQDDMDNAQNVIPFETVDEIPEIAEISFRYFDGESWTTSFSSGSGNYPTAIEVIFQIKSENEAATDQNESEDGTEFGDDITIGAIEDEPDSEFELAGESTDMSINPDFVPDAKRFLIYLGSARVEKRQRIGDENGSLDFEFPGIEK